MKGNLIIFVGVVSTLLIAFLFYFLYINRESNNTLSLILKLILPVIVATLWLLIDVFSSPMDSSSDTTMFIMYYPELYQSYNLQEAVNRLNEGPDIRSGYSEISYLEKKHKDIFNLEAALIPKQLVEVGLFYWYHNEFAHHWQSYEKEYAGLGQKLRISSIKPNSEKTTKKIKIGDIVPYVNESLLPEITDSEVSFPKDSKITRELDKRKHVSYTIKTPEVTLSIKISSVLSDSQLGGSYFYEKISKDQNLYEGYKGYNFEVKFSFVKNRMYQWSPRTKELEKW